MLKYKVVYRECMNLQTRRVSYMSNYQYFEVGKMLDAVVEDGKGFIYKS